MKILPEHESLLTIMSKLIQVVWITFELPMDDTVISIPRDPITNTKTKSSLQEQREDESYDCDEDWNSSLPISSTIDLTSLSPKCVTDEYDDCAPPDLSLIDSMMSWDDVPCRVTGVLARGIY